MAFYMPKSTIYIQSKTKLDIKNIYHTMDEILEIGIKAEKMRIGI